MSLRPQLVLTLAVALAAALPSGPAAGRAAPDRATPLEVGAALAVCLERERAQPYELAGRPDEARLSEGDWSFAVVRRRRPLASDLTILNDPIQPPLVVSLGDRGEAPDYADADYRRRLARDLSRCLSAAYPPD